MLRHEPWIVAVQWSRDEVTCSRAVRLGSSATIRRGPGRWYQSRSCRENFSATRPLRWTRRFPRGSTPALAAAGCRRVRRDVPLGRRSLTRAVILDDKQDPVAGFEPSFSRTSFGTVICPLLVILASLMAPYRIRYSLLSVRRNCGWAGSSVIPYCTSCAVRITPIARIYWDLEPPAVLDGGRALGSNFGLSAGRPLRRNLRGQVAQLVEQRIENPRVDGSIPSLATTSKFLICNGFRASPADYLRPKGAFLG